MTQGLWLSFYPKATTSSNIVPFNTMVGHPNFEVSFLQKWNSYVQTGVGLLFQKICSYYKNTDLILISFQLQLGMLEMRILTVKNLKIRDYLQWVACIHIISLQALRCTVVSGGSQQSQQRRVRTSRGHQPTYLLDTKQRGNSCCEVPKVRHKESWPLHTRYVLILER